MVEPVTSITVDDLSGGIFPKIILPFNETGCLDTEAVMHLVGRLSNTSGIKGIALDMSAPECQCLDARERVDLIHFIRKCLRHKKVLLAGVGPLSLDAIQDAAVFSDAGADVVVTFLASSDGKPTQADRVPSLAATIQELAVPVILSFEGGPTHLSLTRTEIIALAEICTGILGFEVGRDNDVLTYDRDYFTLKSVDRPVAVLTASDGALFHNLNTGSDGILSHLGFVAPHEILEIYQATQSGRFFDAQATHVKLAPLIELLNENDVRTRRLMYRYAAYIQGLIPAPNVPKPEPLRPDLIRKLELTLSDIALIPLA